MNNRVKDFKRYEEGFENIDWGPPASVVGTTIIEDGRVAYKPSSYQKNRLYKRAKELKSVIKSALCTKDECFKPTEYNIKKMLKSEFKVAGHMRAFKKSMEVIGADPEDCSTEKLRRGR